MAKYLPVDLPKNTFVNAGLLAIDGEAWSSNLVTNTALFSEIEYVKRNVAQGEFNTQVHWQLVRNVILYFYCTARDNVETAAINSFLRYVGLADLDAQVNTAERVLDVVEVLHNKATATPWSPPNWVKQHPPTQPLSTQSHIKTTSQDLQSTMLSNTTPQTIPHPPFHHLPGPRLSLASTTSSPAAGVNDPTTNPRYHPLYNFTDHKQEYEGYQFQCPYRCLKDGKHCRKAPVREMNRHLRDRHQRAHGFKIAGVDWEAKRWRGAGAGEPECIGRIVEKDAPDESSDEDETSPTDRENGDKEGKQRSPDGHTETETNGRVDGQHHTASNGDVVMQDA